MDAGLANNHGRWVMDGMGNTCKSGRNSAGVQSYTSILNQGGQSVSGGGKKPWPKLGRGHSLRQGLHTNALVLLPVELLVRRRAILDQLAPATHQPRKAALAFLLARLAALDAPFATPL